MSAPSRCNLRNHPHTTWMQGTRLQMAATTTTIPSQNKACLVKQRSKKVNKLDDMFAYVCRIYTNICLCSIHMYIPLHTWACMYECPVMWCNVACMYIYYIYMCVCVCATGAVNGPAGFAGFCSRLALQLEVALVG